MNLRQMKWASSHDWFVRSRRTCLGTFIVVVREEIPHANGVPETRLEEFADFNDLRFWAGY